MGPRRIPETLQVWIEARRRFRLSHAQLQMARELGLNPKKFGKLDNADQEPWKLPLPLFIERLYLKRFGKRPDVVLSIEERARVQEAKKAAKRAAKQKAREAASAPTNGETAQQAPPGRAILDADDS